MAVVMPCGATTAAVDNKSWRRRHVYSLAAHLRLTHATSSRRYLSTRRTFESSYRGTPRTYVFIVGCFARFALLTSYYRHDTRCLALRCGGLSFATRPHASVARLAQTHRIVLHANDNEHRVDNLALLNQRYRQPLCVRGATRCVCVRDHQHHR